MTPQDTMRLALEALYIAIDLARNHAADVHESYRGYYPERHAAVDADVVTIDAAIEALRSALAQQGDCQCADQRDCTGACCVSKQQGEQQPHECTRSHPHELMDGYCQLHTEIARLTNENARLKAAAPLVEIPTRADVEFARLTGEIQRLAVSIWSSDFRSDSPHWTVLPDAFGALSQISNMVAGMERKAAQEVR